MDSQSSQKCHIIDCGCLNCLKFIVGYINYAQSQFVSPEKVQNWSTDQKQILKQNLRKANLLEHKVTPYSGFKIYNIAESGSSNSELSDHSKEDTEEIESADSNANSSGPSDDSLLIPLSPNEQQNQDMPDKEEEEDSNEQTNTINNVEVEEIKSNIEGNIESNQTQEENNQDIDDSQPSSEIYYQNLERIKMNKEKPQNYETKQNIQKDIGSQYIQNVMNLSDLLQVQLKAFLKLKRINHQKFQNDFKQHLQYEKLKQFRIIDQSHKQVSKELMALMIENFYQAFKKKIKKYQSKEINYQLRRLHQLGTYFISQSSILQDKMQQIDQNSNELPFLLLEQFCQGIKLEISLFRNGLPIYLVKQALKDSFLSNKLTLLIGEPGSGKSTQIPQIVYQLNNLDLSNPQSYQNNKIICVQPRKVMCAFLSQRVNFEMQLRQSVCYHDKDFGRQQKGSEIVFMEESIFLKLFIELLRGSQNKQGNILYQASHVIIDEIDERNIKTDLIISLIYQYFTIEKHHESNKNDTETPLKFIMASSPCYQEIIQQYFANIKEVSTVKIEGRQYPVEVNYQKSEYQEDIKSKVVYYLKNILTQPSYLKKERNQFDGNILVFLQDAADIQETINFVSHKLNISQDNLINLDQKLEKYHPQLFSQLSQKKMIIFSTNINIAETSVMIEDVSFVIDCGIEKIMIFDHKTQSNSYVAQHISKTQAEQRKACAGRTNPGVCFRLYSEKEFNCFLDLKQPEIKRSNLCLILLQMIEAGITKSENFKFLEEIGKEIVIDSLEYLEQIHAVKQKQNDYCLTQMGEFIVKTQFQFPLAAILLKAHSLNVLEQTMEAQAVFQEYNSIFPQPKHDKIREELLDQMTQIKDTGELESDFVFFWKTFQILEKYETDKQFSNLKYQNTLEIQKAFRKVKYVKNGMKKIFNKFIKQFDDEFTESNTKQQSEKDTQENIIRAYLTGYERQIAVFTGINQLGYYNKASNQMFDIHPSSQLFYQSKITNRKFNKGDFFFYVYLEEQETNSYAKGLSQFRNQWLTNSIIIEELQDSTNFQPVYLIEEEKGFLEYFIEREKAQLEAKFQALQKEQGKLGKKGKYYFLYEKNYGRISFYCNQYFTPIMQQINLKQLIEKIKQQYASQKKKKYQVVRFKDTLNFAVIGNGLKVREILLPNQFLKVRASNLPSSCTEKQLSKLVERVELQGKSGSKDNNKKIPAEIKIKRDYENMTAVGEFRFRKTRHAKLFYQSVSEISQKQVNQILQIKQISADIQNKQLSPEKQSNGNQIIFTSVPECEFLLEYSRDFSKSSVKAQWSISPSLGMGQIVFSNELDAFSTLDQLKKQFKASIQERIDSQSGNPLFHVLVERLRPKFDETDLEAYAMNHYDGLVSVEIRREKMNLSYSKNTQYLEKEERQKFNELVLQILPNISLSRSYNLKQTPSNRERISIKISQGVCTALMELDSQSEAQQLVDKLDGIDFGQQKLRLKIQNSLNVPVLGYVYLLSYNAVQKCIRSAAPLVVVKAPSKEDIFYPSRTVFIQLQQSSSGSSQALNQIMISLHNILKFHSLFLEFDPQELEKIMEIHEEERNYIEKQFFCVFRQACRGRAEIKIWFGSTQSQMFVEDCKQSIIDFLSKYVSSDCKLNKDAYDLKMLEGFLIQAKKNKSILSFDLSDQNIVITGYKKNLQEIVNQIVSSKQFQSSSRQAHDVCLICYQAKQLERISCSCLFCKDCLFSYVKAETITFSTKSIFKPVTCPNHPKEPISLKTLSSAFNQSQSQLQDLIQLRIDRAIDDSLDLQSQLPQYIRCPSVNCNEFFPRFYPIEAKEGNSITETNYKSFPFFVKCKSCYQEYCLANSSKKLETDLPIHPTHPGLSCTQYIKQRDIEQQNMKGIVLLACPKCSFKAQKGEGCNHISCKCGAHYCATCLAVFSTPKLVYEHLYKEHQGIY